jgi:peroxiredoxin
MAERAYIALQPGEPAPWFRQRSNDHPYYAFDTAAGRYLVLCFLASSQEALGAGALKSVAEHRALFDDKTFSFFGVTMDRRDDAEKLLQAQLPGIRHLFDFDGTVGKLYGALPADMRANEANVPMRRFWVVVGPTLRVLHLFPFEANGDEQAALFHYLRSLPPPAMASGFAQNPPLIMLDNVFEPDLCQGIVTLFRVRNKRDDYVIEDGKIRQAIQIRVQRRILPEMLKAFQFRPTRMENYVVSSLGKKVLPPHRDNMGRGVAHRRFSISINLNDDFAGGGLVFPEYSAQEFRAPAGGACVFSSSLLYADTPVPEGRRLTFRPFLFDDQAAQIHAQNAASAPAMAATPARAQG